VLRAKPEAKHRFGFASSFSLLTQINIFMNALSQILNSATMGHPRRLRPLIGWTIAEYFFRGAPYGAMLLVVWEVFKPLQDPGMSINLVNIGWACLLLFISLICLWLIAKKAYLVAYRDGYEICCNGRLAVVDHLRRLPMNWSLFFDASCPRLPQNDW